MNIFVVKLGVIILKGIFVNFNEMKKITLQNWDWGDILNFRSSTLKAKALFSVHYNPCTVDRGFLTQPFSKGWKIFRIEKKNRICSLFVHNTLM